MSTYLPTCSNIYRHDYGDYFGIPSAAEMAAIMRDPYKDDPVWESGDEEACDVQVGGTVYGTYHLLLHHTLI